MTRETIARYEIQSEIGRGGMAAVYLAYESSAVLPRTEIHPVRQYHGTLFNDKDVKMRLKLELLQNRGSGS